jgi:hypothetical protein
MALAGMVVPITPARLERKRICAVSTDLKLNCHAVYEGRIGFGTYPALLLVDFVQPYFDKPRELYPGVEAALASAIHPGVPAICPNVETGPEWRLFLSVNRAAAALSSNSPLGGWPTALRVSDLASTLTNVEHRHLDYFRIDHHRICPRELSGCRLRTRPIRSI